MRNRAYFFSIEYVYLQLRGERSRELNRLLSYWLSLPKVALHLHKVEGFWTLSCRWTRPIQSPTVAVARVAGNRQLSIEMNGIVSLCRWVSLVVWTGLQLGALESAAFFFFRWHAVVAMQTRRDWNVSPSIIFHNNIMVVWQFNLVKKINTRSTVGSPAPPPLWLVGLTRKWHWWVQRFIQRKNAGTLSVSAKKTLSARHAPGVLKNAALPFRTIEKIRQPQEKKTLWWTRGLRITYMDSHFPFNARYNVITYVMSY